MYNFNNKTNVKTAVNELAAAANNGELYIIADEAFYGAGLPENCERCADNIVNLLVELRVGQSGHDLQYRDTVILCDGPRDNLPVVSRLRASGLPVQVVTIDDDEAAIRDLAVAMNDTIMSDPPRDALYIRTGFGILTLVNRMSVTASIILIFTIVINSSFIVINN
nr:hypothetical protein BaRGS_033832 [Batillaria attramentaria]